MIGIEPILFFLEYIPKLLILNEALFLMLLKMTTKIVL